LPQSEVATSVLFETKKKNKCSVTTQGPRDKLCIFLITWFGYQGCDCFALNQYHFNFCLKELSLEKKWKVGK
jgi:hypothetical protein